MVGDEYLWLASEKFESQKTSIFFKVINRSDKPIIAAISVYDKNKDQDYLQKNYVPNDSTAVFPFEIPLHKIGREIFYYLEINGTKTENSSLEVQTGTRTIEFDVIKELGKIPKASTGISARDIVERGILGGANSEVRRLGRTMTKSLGW